MRGPLRHQKAADGRSACDARLARALVDAMLHLEKAAAAFGVHVIGDGRAAGGYGFGEHLDDGGVKAADAVQAQAGGLGERVDSGAEQRLIGVNVAEARGESADPGEAP